MNLTEHIQQLQDFIKEHPEAAELPVMISSDEEGNSFRELYWTPCLRYYDDDHMWDTDEAEDYKDTNEEPLPPPNAVLI